MNTTKRKKRHNRIRAKVAGTSERPRASVFRSNRFVSVQLIDDVAGTTVAAVVGSAKAKQDKTQQAVAAGKEIAELAKKQGIVKVVFDRGGYQYHGRVKALAESMRENGLLF